MAVYDGHAGTDAATYAATHLHHNIFSQPSFATDPVRAIREAYRMTDERFLEKCKREVSCAMPSQTPVILCALEMVILLESLAVT